MPNQNISGASIQKIRLQKSMTQDDLAAKCQVQGWDISRTTIAKIESGVRRVNDAEIMMFALVLGAGPEELFETRKKKDVLPVLLRGSGQE